MRAILGTSIALAAALAATTPALAQGFVPAPTPTADALADQMRALASNPRDVSALIAAGELSTKLGDYDAASAFFARAEAIDARNPRLGAARAVMLVQLERPGEALRLWDAAERGGVAMTPYLAARGLAWDLVGQPAAAQRDYRRALLNERDDETVRRLALSLGISGQDGEALALIDPLLRRQDRAAWRARAFVLAMAGQGAEAERIAASSVVGGAQMGPFLAMLRTLSPADRAFAVHFGSPSSSPIRLADARLAPLPTGVALATVATPPLSRPVAIAPLPAPVTRAGFSATAPGRTPIVSAPVAALPSQPIITATRSATPAPQVAPVAASTAPSPVTTAATPAAVAPVPTPIPTPVATASTVAASQPTPTAETPPPAAVASAPTPATVAPSAIEPTPATPTPQPPAPAVAKWSLTPNAPVVRTPEVARRNTALLAAVVAGIDVPASELAVSPPPRPAKPIAKPKPEPKKPDPVKDNPQRWWVQVAGGANESDLGKEWKRVAAKAPAAFRGKSAWTTPLRATNRLLAGPFASQDAAMGFVNTLKKEGVATFAWQSPAGQAIDKLETR